MTLDDSIQGFRLRVLQATQRSGNVSATCRRYDVSRTVFYRWRARLTRYGPDGLHPKRRTARRGRPPELTVTDERRVIAEARAWPTRGPQWVSDRLARQGRVIAPVTVWRVLRRVGLNHRLARLAVLEDQGAATGLLTERTVRRRRRGRHVAAAHPGDLCSLDSFYIGKLKGVGKVWQLTACDCASSYGWARIVVGEVTAAVMAAFLVELTACDCAASSYGCGADRGRRGHGGSVGWHNRHFLVEVVRPGYRAAGWRLRRVSRPLSGKMKRDPVAT